MPGERCLPKAGYVGKPVERAGHPVSKTVQILSTCFLASILLFIVWKIPPSHMILYGLQV
eukprot:6300402-Amphidinium_carterae.1